MAVGLHVECWRGEDADQIGIFVLRYFKTLTNFSKPIMLS